MFSTVLGDSSTAKNWWHYDIICNTSAIFSDCSALPNTQSASDTFTQQHNYQIDVKWAAFIINVIPCINLYKLYTGKEDMTTPYSYSRWLCHS